MTVSSLVALKSCLKLLLVIALSHMQRQNFGTLFLGTLGLKALLLASSPNLRHIYFAKRFHSRLNVILLIYIYCDFNAFLIVILVFRLFKL